MARAGHDSPRTLAFRTLAAAQAPLGAQANDSEEGPLGQSVGQRPERSDSADPPAPRLFHGAAPQRPDAGIVS